MNTTKHPSDTSQDAAVNLIRRKVESALGHEPNAEAEMVEAAESAAPSRHQRYMQSLSASGMSLAEIQTAWHQYYTGLPDAEKHQVWQEFYAANQNSPHAKALQAQGPTGATAPPSTESIPRSVTGAVVGHNQPSGPAGKRGAVAARQAKDRVLHTINAGGKLKMKHHLQSLAFGLSIGFVVLAVFLFSFFNQYIIAPFIQPSRTVSATPIIAGGVVDPNAPASVTIPKINVQIPIDFTITSTNETVIENGLNNGVVHYPNTVLPGQNGTAAYFGHSSQNIFNNGKYKFAFTLLHTLTTGDTFYINYQGKTYAYEVFAREVVPPSQVSVLQDNKGKQAVAMLITCDPPGFSTNRLVLWGEQISPSVSSNTTPDTIQTTPSAAEPTQLASNGQTLWGKFVDKLTFWN